MDFVETYWLMTNEITWPRYYNIKKLNLIIHILKNLINSFKKDQSKNLSKQSLL